MPRVVFRDFFRSRQRQQEFRNLGLTRTEPAADSGNTSTAPFGLDER